MLWDLNDGKHLYTLDHPDIINALCFSPNRYWLCVATGPSIKVWVSSQQYTNTTPRQFLVAYTVREIFHRIWKERLW